MKRIFQIMVIVKSLLQSRYLTQGLQVLSCPLFPPEALERRLAIFECGFLKVGNLRVDLFFSDMSQGLCVSVALSLRMLTIQYCSF